MIKPISPQEVAEQKLKSIPPEVIESFNELIVEDFNGRSSIVKQKDVIDRIIEKLPHLTSSDIFTKKWLDIEELYKANGWKVEYDKPEYNADYSAFFEFVKK